MPSQLKEVRSNWRLWSGVPSPKNCTCPPDDCAAAVRRALAGDQEAYSWIDEKFRPIAERLARRVIGRNRHADWEDCAQEAMIKVHIRLGQWKGRAPFCTYVMVVAARTALDALRGDRVRRRHLPTTGSWSEEPDAGAFDPGTDEAPSEAKGIEPDALDCLEKTVASMDPMDARIFQLWSEGGSVRQIGAAVGLSHGAVQNRLRQSFERLRPCFS
ncbi:MAG: RNA polymerase sigma factor [Planctomycetes bacterium]|nr:RNA polymerase sigma factor [Planctomycetota bacterium]